VLANGRTGKTANHKLKCLRSIFGDAVKASALLQNPALSVKQVNEDDSTPREPFTFEQVSALAKNAISTDWRGLILLSAFTGIRLTDCAKLKAGNIDLDRKVIRLMPAKTDRKKKVIEIPMHSSLVNYFHENPPAPFTANPLFPSLAKVSTGGRNGLSTGFRQIMDAAGIDRIVTRRTQDGAARETATYSFHCLRHSFTSMLANAGVSEEVRTKMTGHSDSTSHQIYTHLELETMRKGVELIPSLPPAPKAV
jgi:integrase